MKLCVLDSSFIKVKVDLRVFHGSGRALLTAHELAFDMS